MATSARRSPATRRVPPKSGSPACSGVIRARRGSGTGRTGAADSAAGLALVDAGGDALHRLRGVDVDVVVVVGERVVVLLGEGVEGELALDLHIAGDVVGEGDPQLRDGDET